MLKSSDFANVVLNSYCDYNNFVGSFFTTPQLSRRWGEVAPCYVFLASDDASYITGQVLHPNGGTIVGS